MTVVSFSRPRPHPAPCPAQQPPAHDQVLAGHLVVAEVEDAELLEVVVVPLLQHRAAVCEGLGVAGRVCEAGPHS